MRILLMIVMLSPLLFAVVQKNALAQMTASDRDFVLSEHNRLRRDAIGPGGPGVVSPVTATAMLEFEYDIKLECVAQGYLDRLPPGGNFTHNVTRVADYLNCGGSGTVGENWYSGNPHDSLTGGATNAWVDFVWPIAWGGNNCSERQNYHGDGGCSGEVGHYTQVLWSNTVKVGCGFRTGWGTVCNYSPSGNFVGQLPFTMGPSCSACPASHPYCNDGLCSRVPVEVPIFANGFEELP